MNQEMLNELRESYDRAAASYRVFVNELDHKPFDRDILRRFAGLTKGGRVCEVGCGTGHVAAFLKAAGADVFGVDLSEGMVREAKALHPDLEFRTGNMFALDLPDDSLEGIAAFYAIVNIPPDQLPDVFREFHRVLRPGGRLLMSFHVGKEKKRVMRFLEQDVNMDFYFLDPDDVIAKMEEAHFQVEEAVIRYPYKDVEFPSKRAYLSALVQL